MKANTDNFIKMHGTIWQVIACLDAREAEWCDDKEAIERIREICDGIKSHDDFQSWVDKVEEVKAEEDREEAVQAKPNQVFCDLSPHGPSGALCGYAVRYNGVAVSVKKYCTHQALPIDTIKALGIQCSLK